MYKEDNNIGFRYFPANHLTLMSKSKELLDRNRNNLCEWRESFFSVNLHYENLAKRVDTLRSGHHFIDM